MQSSILLVIALIARNRAGRDQCKSRRDFAHLKPLLPMPPWQGSEEIFDSTKYNKSGLAEQTSSPPPSVLPEGIGNAKVSFAQVSLHHAKSDISPRLLVRFVPFVRTPQDIVDFDPKKVKAQPYKDDIDALDYRIYLQYEDKRISPWHDIPYESNRHQTADGTTLLHFVCEIPKGTARKYGIVTTEQVEGDEGPIFDNPIMQHREIDHQTHQVIIEEYKYPTEKPQTLWNVGAAPQTWENPHRKAAAETWINGKADHGDDAPLDLLQLNDAPCKIGDVQVVRPLGAFAPIEDGKTDWKILVVDVNAGDTASKWKTLQDVPKNTQTSLIDWFKNYQIPEGKGKHTFKANANINDEKFAAKLAWQIHKEWCGLTKVEQSYCKEPESSAGRVKVLLSVLVSAFLQYL